MAKLVIPLRLWTAVYVVVNGGRPVARGVSADFVSEGP